MTRLKNFIIATVLLLVLLGAGIFAGKSYFERTTPSTVMPSAPEGANSNIKRFLVSPPSIGVAPETVDTPVSFRVGMANIVLTADQAAKVRVGQKALLYDADGKMLDALADVVTVQPHEPGAGESPVSIVMIVSLNNAYAQSVFKSARILVGRDDVSLRLPESAVVHGEDGTARMWMVDQESKAQPVDIDVLDRLEGAVVFARRTSAFGNLYILNPDASLKQGQRISVEETAYAGPSLLPDAMVAKRSQDKSRAALEKMAQKSARGIESHAMSKPAVEQIIVTPEQNMSMACDAPSTDMQIFIGLIKAPPPRAEDLPHTEKPLPVPAFPAVIAPPQDNAAH